MSNNSSNCSDSSTDPKTSEVHAQRAVMPQQGAGGVRQCLNELADQLGSITNPTLCMEGALLGYPKLSVCGPDVHDEFEPVSLPLTAAQHGKLAALCHRAPFGRGRETVYDETVRRTLELDADRVRIDDATWLPSGERLATVLAQISKEMRVPGASISAELYKLLLYEEGSFFAKHRDNEKTDGMFGTLVLTLPSPHFGSELVVYDGAGKPVQTFGGCGREGTTAWVAFYADCEHEVRELRAGVRVALVFNLIAHEGSGGRLASLEQAISERTWQAASRVAWAFRPFLPKDWPGPDLDSPSTGGAGAGSPLGIFVRLAHQYTPDGLARNLFKGADNKLVDAIASYNAAVCARDRSDLAVAVLAFEHVVVESGTFLDEDFRENRWGYTQPNPGDQSNREFEVEECVEDRWECLSSTFCADIPSPRTPGVASTVVLALEPNLLQHLIQKSAKRKKPFEELEQSGSDSEEWHYDGDGGYMGNYAESVERSLRRATLVVVPLVSAFAWSLRKLTDETCELPQAYADLLVASEGNAPPAWLRSAVSSVFAARLAQMAHPARLNYLSILFESLDANVAESLVFAGSGRAFSGAFASVILVSVNELAAGTCGGNWPAAFAKWAGDVFASPHMQGCLDAVREALKLAAQRTSNVDCFLAVCQRLDKAHIAALFADAPDWLTQVCDELGSDAASADNLAVVIRSLEALCTLAVQHGFTPDSTFGLALRTKAGPRMLLALAGAETRLPWAAVLARSELLERCARMPMLGLPATADFQLQDELLMSIASLLGGPALSVADPSVVAGLMLHVRELSAGRLLVLLGRASLRPDVRDAAHAALVEALRDTDRQLGICECVGKSEQYDLLVALAEQAEAAGIDVEVALTSRFAEAHAEQVLLHIAENRALSGPLRRACAAAVPLHVRENKLALLREHGIESPAHLNLFPPSALPILTASCQTGCKAQVKSKISGQLGELAYSVCVFCDRAVRAIAKGSVGQSVDVFCGRSVQAAPKHLLSWIQSFARRAKGMVRLEKDRFIRILVGPPSPLDALTVRADAVLRAAAKRPRGEEDEHAGEPAAKRPCAPIFVDDKNECAP